MTWADWRTHFERNRERELPPVTAAEIPEAWRSSLARSLARFQLGEAGEGRIARQIDSVLLRGIDPRVPQSEAEQIVQAVRKRGKDVWYLLGLNEGHGFQKKENRDYSTSRDGALLPAEADRARELDQRPGLRRMGDRAGRTLDYR